MNKYLACIALSSFVTFSSFAGSFAKIDTGMVSWNAEGREKVGTLNVSRVESKLELNNVTAFELLRLTLSNVWSLPVGKIITSEIKLATMDERSSEIVGGVIKEKSIAEMKSIVPGTEIVDTQVELENVVCVEKGFFKKTLSCQANYTNSMQVQFVK